MSWNYVDIEKIIIPRLCSSLRHQAYGSYNITYPAILPFINFIPYKHKEKPKFILDIIHATWHGLFNGIMTVYLFCFL